MRGIVIVGTVLIVLGVFATVVLDYGCRRPSPARPGGSSKWSSDGTKLASAVPLLRVVESASWTVEKDTDRSAGMVPGPSAYATLGFAKVDATTIDELAALGKSPDDGSVLKGVEGHLAEIGVNPSGRSWVRVSGLQPALVGSTKFHRGVILLDEGARVVYFRLVAD